MDSSLSVAIGCTVAVASSAIQSFGITLQRKSHLIHTSVVHKRNMWLCGFLLFIIANVFGSLIQITTLPLLILSPLQSIGLIFNSIFSCMLLPGEKYTLKLGFGTITIALGACIVAYQGNTTNPSPPLEDDDPDPIHSPGSGSGSGDQDFEKVVEMLLRRQFFTWFVATFIGMGIIVIIIRLINRQRRQIQFKWSLTTLNRLRSRYNALLHRSQFTKGVLYGLISGTLTAHTFLFAKSLVDVIVQKILNSKDKFSLNANSTPYVLLLVMLGIIALQLTAFNMGLSQISTGILYPLCFLVYNSVNLINDLLFNQILSQHKMTILQLIWVIFGLLFVFLGIVLISWDSAFGNNVSDYEETDLMNLKFPYTDTQGKKLYGSSTHGGPGSRISLETITGEERQWKRDLSYEENQLLNIMGLV